MKLLRTIRLDPSDTFVFDRSAEPGEWAVTGTFMFADDDPSVLEGKARAAEGVTKIVGAIYELGTGRVRFLE